VREIALHILDIARNSIEAGATDIDLTIIEDEEADRLEIVVRDNGAGMDEEQLRRVTDPFYSTRTTRRIGLGLPLLKASCERCDGEMRIESQPGEGTTVRCVLRLGHLDRPPLGDMGAVIEVLACESDHVHLRYRHQADGNVFEFDSRQAQTELEDTNLTDPAVLHWLGKFVRANLRNIGSISQHL